MAEFTRPQDGFRFSLGGVNTKEVPDALPAGKYQALLNVRATAEDSLRTRPGYINYFTCDNGNNNFAVAAITDMRAYTALNTSAFPRVLARDANGRVFLDNGVEVGNLAGNAGYGASMNPFRPRESATPWMYVAATGDYQRFSSPDANNNVVQNKVGIAEPQLEVEAQSQDPNWQYLGPGNNNAVWPISGNNNGNTYNVTRANESVATVPLVDPVWPARQSILINGNSAHGIGEVLAFNSNNSNFMAYIEDVIPAVGNNTAMVFSTIRYQSGNNGNCTIYVGALPGQSDLQGVLSGLRRGAVIWLSANNNHNEYCLVYDVVFGANGIVAIDTATAGAWGALSPKNIQFPPTLVVNTANNVVSGMSMISTGMAANLNAGISYTSFNMTGANYFASVRNQAVQEDDYIHLSVMIADPTQLIQMLLLFYLDTPLSFGTAGDILYYAVRPGDLTQVLSGSQQVVPAILSAAETQVIIGLPTAENIAAPAQSSAGNNMWSELLIPVSSLQRLGSDLTKTLANCIGFQIQFNVANNTTVGWSAFWNAAGNGPDVGNNGAPYKYLAVPSNSTTGVDGSPTPLMKYGVNPRRQAVLVNTANLNSSYDPQIDTWKIYRFGGSVTSYRFLGTTPANSNFIDTFFDDAAQAGDEVVIDNTEPWPTIDQPWTLSGNSNAYGQWLVCTSNNFPASMNRWLPGTLFTVGTSQDAFTLRSRPIITPGNNGPATAVFEFEECVGAGAQANRVFVLEPNVANQPLPYVWGPDEYGYSFGAGDIFRPSTVYWTKAFTPDSVPTANTLEVCSPSEPLLGGRVIKGVSFVASSKRWWVLNFQSGNAEQQFVPVEAPVKKRLACPYGIESDGSAIYFWADDCIARTEGGEAISLIDEDLYNLFPHSGTAGVNVVRAGVTFYAPDYSRVAQFRLTYRNGMLYALYLDSTGAYRMLVLDVLRKAWSQDQYDTIVTATYSIEQPKAALQGAQNLYPGLIYGDINGQVWKVQDLTNDGVVVGLGAGVGIPVVVATREFNAGDARTNTSWGDLFIDLVAPAGANCTPIVQGQAILDANNNAIVTVIAANNARQFVPVSVEGVSLQTFLGLKVTWTDNFYNANFANPVFGVGGYNFTQLNVWQPSYADKPETITTRFGDTVDFGQASYVRGVTIYADTFGANKSIMIRNMDNNTLVPLQSVASSNNVASVINHAGEQTINYWFNPPFVAHMVRDESQDAVPWRKFKFEYIKDAWPELTDLPSPWLDMGTPSAKFVQGVVVPLDTNGAGGNPSPSPGARLTALQPHRTLHLQGTDRTGAMGALCQASASGFTVQMIFRDQADFTKLMLYDADDFFGQYQTTKYLPNFQFNGCVLSFSVAYNSLFPLESNKFASIFQTYIGVAFSDTTASTTIAIPGLVTGVVGSVAASAVYTVVASPAVIYDRVQLWYQDIVFDFVAAGGETSSVVAANLAAQINAVDWASINPTMAVFAQVDEAEITVFAAVWGTVNTNGVNVTLASGEGFLTIAPLAFIQINGVVYVVSAVTSSRTIVLTASAGNQSGVGYVAPGQGVDGNSITMYTLNKTSTLSITPSSSVHMSGGQIATSINISLDFTAALGATLAAKIRQIWMVFAPALNYPFNTSSPALAAFSATPATAVFANWLALNAPELLIAGPNSVRSTSAAASYSGTGWSVISGFYDGGFAQTDATSGDTVTARYSCASGHDLYLGTVLNTNCGIVSVTVDGGSPITVDCYLNVLSALVTRRLLKANMTAGSHTVVITMSGTKNASSSGYNFTFDFVEAAAGSVPVNIGSVSPNRNAATDYDTAHGYALSPQRLIWMMQQCGFTGDWEHYIGAFFWPNRVRFGGSFSVATVTFSGTFTAGDGFGGGADNIFITIGGTTCGKVVFPQDTLTTIAAHFAYEINSIFVGVRATSSAGVLTVTVLSPINGFTISESFTPASGSTGVVTLAGNLLAAAEGVWQVDPTNPGLNAAAAAWHEDFLASLSLIFGQKATIGFSQEIAGSPDNPPTSVWRQRFLSGLPVETGTSLGTAGAAFVLGTGNNNTTVNAPGHGYLTGYNVLVTNNNNGFVSQYGITVLDANNFNLTTPVGAVIPPAANDTLAISWQSDQLAFSNNVSTFIGQGHLAVANLYAGLNLVPQLQMAEILHWFFSSDRIPIASIGNNGGSIQVNTATPHGWGNNYYAIVPIFEAANANVPVRYNAAKITVGNNNSFVLQGSNYAANLTPGPLAFGGSMAYYDADQEAAANTALGRNLATFYTQDDPPTINNSADATFLASRLTAYATAVQAPVLAAYPNAIYELLWPQDVNRPNSPFFTLSQPYPQGGRLNAFVNLPAAWKQQAGSGFQYFKTEALSWSATYQTMRDTLAAIGYSTDVLSWTAAQSRYLIAWFNGICYWSAEYFNTLPVGFNWVGFFAFDQLCLLSWLLAFSDAEAPGVYSGIAQGTDGVSIEIISSDGDVVVLPSVQTPAGEKTSVPFSFPSPIIAHEVRFKPLGPCRIWWNEAVWHFQRTPEAASTWTTQFTGFGIKGFKSILRMEACYNSTETIQLTISVQDGTAPQVITLPGSGGAPGKFLLTPTFNKGQMYRFSAVSNAPFQMFLEDFIIWIGEWGRTTEAAPFSLGAEFGDKATI